MLTDTHMNNFLVMSTIIRLPGTEKHAIRTHIIAFCTLNLY